MPADLINLNRARKAKERAAKEARAVENRMKFGRTKDERLKAERTEEIEARRLSGHEREKDVSGGGDGEGS